jgi:hypothetical protein
VVNQDVLAERGLGAGPWAGISVGILLLVVVSAAALWLTFTKAGRLGWAAIVPFYRWYVLLKIAGRPGWWLVLLLVPVVNLVVWLLVALSLSRSFGRGEVFAVLALWLFPLVGHVILGFGSARYRGPAGPARPEQEAMAGELR